MPYCGTAPLPGELLSHFNFDPWLLVALASLGIGHTLLASSARTRRFAAAGWLIASAAFISPLCALSVSLFSARVAQHMVLALIAAPLIAFALPKISRGSGPWALCASTTTFLLALWFWHMPSPYDATFSSVFIYWTMHLTLFGSSIWVWRELLHHRPGNTVITIAAGSITFMQMSFLGAVLTFADHPLYAWHLVTARAWGLSALQDQQLGGVLMWVPGGLIFLWVAIRSSSRVLKSLSMTTPA